jgi:hypothetical protein
MRSIRFAGWFRLAAVLALSLPGAALAQSTTTDGTTTDPTTTGVTVAAATNGVDDKCYNSLVPGAVTGALFEAREAIDRFNNRPRNERTPEAAQALVKKVREQIERVSHYAPPASIITYSGQGRWGGDVAFASVGVGYSDNLRSFDLGAQGFLGGVYGFAVAGKLDFSPGRRDLVREIRRLRTEYPSGERGYMGLREAPPSDAGVRAKIQGAVKNLGELERSGQPVPMMVMSLERTLTEFQLLTNDEYRPLAKAFVKAATHPRTALVVDHTRVPGSGSLTGGGVSLSWLRPFIALRSGAVPMGISGLVSVQGAAADLEGTPAHGLVRWGAALAVQNKIPRVITRKDGHGRESLRVARWRLRAGVEYTDQTRLVTESGMDAFVTYRHEPRSGYQESIEDLYRRFMEFTLFGGRGLTGAGFVGLRIARSL